MFEVLERTNDQNKHQQDANYRRTTNVPQNDDSHLFP